MLPREITPLSPVLQSHWLEIHIVLAFLGNAAFALAFGIGVMYLVQEHYVKSKNLGGLFGRLPSLQTLDEINYKLITIGFPLLTLAIITGVFWAESAWGSYWNWDPRAGLVADNLVHLCDYSPCKACSRLEGEKGRVPFDSRIPYNSHRLFRNYAA